MNSPPAKSWLILDERARRHFWKGQGWLSIKSFEGGRAQYSVNQARYAVNDESYLILNHGQEYQVEIDQMRPIESFCIFFAPGFLEQALEARSLEHLDVSSNADSIHFFERTYSHDNSLTPVLRRLKQRWRFAEKGWVDEQMQIIAEKMLETHCRGLKEAQTLSNARAATREELYRRVWRARDYAEAMFSQEVSLADMASAAALSPNHLLRTFKEIFRQSPHEFLRTRRLQEAARLLQATEFSVTEICLRVGFQSLGSFSAVFKEQIGLSPAAYRASKR